MVDERISNFSSVTLGLCQGYLCLMDPFLSQLQEFQPLHGAQLRGGNLQQVSGGHVGLRAHRGLLTVPVLAAVSVPLE